MTLRVGIDVVDVGRMRRVAGHPSALRRVFTVREREYCNGRRDPGPHFAARFAAKEAVLKAFGVGLARGMRWTDVEVVRGASGRPGVELHGAVAEWARRHGLRAVDVSLTHDAGVAMAHAVATLEAR